MSSRLRAVDETGFVKAVTATACPTTGLNNCLGGEGTSICQGCLQDTQVEFSFRLGNAIVAPTATPQVFDFDMVAMADGTVELTRIPVRVMVPETGGSYGAGFYQNTYEADVVCADAARDPARLGYADLDRIDAFGQQCHVRVLHGRHAGGPRFVDSGLGHLSPIRPMRRPRAYDIGALSCC